MHRYGGLEVGCIFLGDTVQSTIFLNRNLFWIPILTSAYKILAVLELYNLFMMFCRIIGTKRGP